MTLGKLFMEAWTDGLLTALLFILFKAYKKHVVPRLKHRFNNKHVDHALDMTERFAGIFIPEFAKMANMTNNERKQEVCKLVTLHLIAHGLPHEKDTVSATVEKVYQYMKNVGHLDIDKPIKTPDPSNMTPQQINKFTPPDVHNDVDNGGDNSGRTSK